MEADTDADTKPPRGATRPIEKNSTKIRLCQTAQGADPADHFFREISAMSTGARTLGRLSVECLTAY